MWCSMRSRMGCSRRVCAWASASTAMSPRVGPGTWVVPLSAGGGASCETDADFDMVVGFMPRGHEMLAVPARDRMG
jgi:hypothetical protein